MGIPGFATFLQQQYPDVFVKLANCPWKIVHLYFDLNHILHSCTRQQNVSSPSLTGSDADKFATGVLDWVFWYVESMRENGISVKSITICMDGPPSVRKFQEQRDRRRNRLQKKEDDEITGEDLLGLALTPGTDFMDDLSKQLSSKLRSRQRKPGLNCPVIFSDSNAPGEGEHKIVSGILKSERSTAGSNHMIIGGDADLIVIAMTLAGGIAGDVGIYNETLFVASKLVAALGCFSSSPGAGRGPMPKGSVALSLQRPKEKPQVDLRTRQAATADFAFLSLLGGNDYLSAAIKRPKKASKSYLDWLLPRYKMLKSPFLEATESEGPSGMKVWHFRIAQPEALAKLLSYDSTPSTGSSLTDDEVANCEDYLEGMLWAITTFANGLAPSYLTNCSVKVSVWSLIDYLRAEPERAQDLHVLYSSSDEFPVCPLTVAACVLPWRDPVLDLLGEVGPAVLELVQSEFEDLFEFESACDAQQLQWVKHGTWNDALKPSQTPKGLALRDLQDFDQKVRCLAKTQSLHCKTAFSDIVCIQEDDTAQAIEEDEVADEEEPLQEGDAAEELVEEDQEVDAVDICAVGDVVECYWPDDDVWLRAVVKIVHDDRSLTITWEEDPSESIVPAEYVRLPQEDIVTEPPVKRARR